MLRKVALSVTLVPLALALLAFAAANRAPVTVSLDPLNPVAPALSFAVPLFALSFAILILGVLIGGVAAWLRQGRHRRQARQQQGEIRQLRREIEIMNVRLEAASRGTPQDAAARVSYQPSV